MSKALYTCPMDMDCPLHQQCQACKLRSQSKLRAEAEADTGVQTHESCRGQYVPYKCAMPNPRSYGIHPEETLGETGMHLAPAAPAV